MALSACLNLTLISHLSHVSCKSTPDLSFMSCIRAPGFSCNLIPIIDWRKPGSGFLISPGPLCVFDCLTRRRRRQASARQRPHRLHHALMAGQQENGRFVCGSSDYHGSPAQVCQPFCHHWSTFMAVLTHSSSRWSAQEMAAFCKRAMLPRFVSTVSRYFYYYFPYI